MMGAAIEISLQQIQKRNWKGQLGIIDEQEIRDLIKAIYELKDIEELLFQVVGFAASGFFEGKASSSQRKHK